MSGAKYEFGQKIRLDGRADGGRFVAYSSDKWAHVLLDDGSLKQVYIADIVPEPPPDGTVPVRIAVAVDKWGAASSVCGFSDDADAARMACEALCSADQCRITFINTYAYLPAAPAEVNATPEVSDED